VYSGAILVFAGASAGTAVDLWIDDAGWVVAPPRTHNQTVSRAIAAGPVAVFGFACGL
jgi:hypothetical protein